MANVLNALVGKLGSLGGTKRIAASLLLTFAALFQIFNGNANATPVNLSCSGSTGTSVAQSSVTGTTTGSFNTDRLTVTNAPSGTIITLTFTATSPGNKTQSSLLFSGAATGPVGAPNINGNGASGTQTYTTTSATTQIIDITLTKGTGSTGSATSMDWTATCSAAVVTPSLSITGSVPAAEGGANGSFTITASSAVTSNTTVNFTMSGSATSGTDYTVGTATILSGQTSVLVPIDVNTANNDIIVEGTETATLTINAGTGYTIGSPSSAQINIADNDTATLAISSPTVSEGAGTATFTVTLTGQTQSGFTVSYGSLTNVTTAAADYGVLPASPLSFTGGVLNESHTIVVPITDDGIVEGTETATLTLSGVSTSFGGELTIPGAGNTGTLTINDNDTATVSLTASTNGTEEGGSHSITATQTAISSTDTVISLTCTPGTAAATDYTCPASITIVAGTTFTTLPVSVVNDSIVEGAETFNVALNIITSGDPDISTAGTPRTLTITDSDSAVADISLVSDGAEGGNATFKVALTGTTEIDLIIPWTLTHVTTAAGDFTGSLSGTVTVPAGTDSTQNFTVAINDDAIVEGIETYTVAIGPAGTGFTIGVSPATGTIAANDSAVASISLFSNSAEGADAIFTVTLTGTTTSSLTIPWTIVNGTTANGDFTTLSGTVIVPAGIDPSNTFNVAIFDDAIAEGLETYQAKIGPAGTGYTISTDSAAGTIAANDTAGITVAVTDGAATEGGDAGAFTVVLTSQPVGTVTVAVGSSAQCTFSPTSVTFDSTNWSTPKPIAVVAIDDAVVEGAHSCSPSSITATSSDSYDGLTAAAPSIDIADDDVASNNEVVQNAFESQTHNFMVRRNDLITSHEPTLYRLIRRNEDGELGGGTNGFNIVGEGGNITGDFKFDARSVSRAFNAAANGNSNITPTADLPTRSTFLNAWVEGEFGLFRDDSGQQAQKGDFFIGYAGVDARISNRVLLGVMGQIDWTEDRGQNTIDKVNGTGWMVGPYLSSEPADNVFFDLRAMWGTSDNSAIQEVLGSPYQGKFDTERWLMQALLSGKYQSGNIGITPEMSVIYMDEKQNGYSVSDGINTVAVAGQDVALGRLAAGMKFSYLTQMDDVTIEPYLGGRVLWDFVNPGMMNLDGTLATREDIRGQVSAGINFKGKNSMLSIETIYDGLGTAGLEALSGKMLYSLQF